MKVKPKMETESNALAESLDNVGLDDGINCGGDYNAFDAKCDLNNDCIENEDVLDIRNESGDFESENAVENSNCDEKVGDVLENDVEALEKDVSAENDAESLGKDVSEEPDDIGGSEENDVEFLGDDVVGENDVDVTFESGVAHGNVELSVNDVSNRYDIVAKEEEKDVPSCENDVDSGEREDVSRKTDDDSPKKKDVPKKNDVGSPKKSKRNDVQSSPQKLSNSTSLNDGLILVASTDHPLALNKNFENSFDSTENAGEKSENTGTENSSENTGKKRRRVHFHDDEDRGVVKSFHDPPDPWSNAPAFTPEQLVESYRQACTQYGCKPIQKLISQLEATRDFGERYDTLTLKGERLDKRHCDALEEILKRVQFKTMDLEATDLDDDSAGAIFDMVEFYDSATRIVLAYNKSIGPRGWQACSRLMKRTPGLLHLDLRCCTITDHSMPFLGRALRVGSHLQVLHLENSGVSNKVLLILVAALKLNEPLKELYLADNRLMPSDGVQLGNLLKHNDRLQLLDLRNNHLQDTGLTHIADGLEVQDQKGWGLSTLVLWNNQLTQHSMPKLAQALAANRNLETLNLGHNNLGNEGILLLKEGLLSNRVLKRLGLQSSRLSCEASIAIAELIADSKCLVRVDLRENDIKTAGLMALSLSLKMNQSVTRLDLDKEPKKERGVKDFMEQQASLLSDISNWLQRNREQAYCLEQEMLKKEKEREAEEKMDKEKEGLSSERVERESVEKPKAQLHFDLNRSQSLESPADIPENFVLEEELLAKESEVENLRNQSRKRTGNRMFSVKYVPENSLSESGLSIIPVSPSDTVVSPTLEFPLSIDPAVVPVLPVLVPVDSVNSPPVMLVPLDERSESERASENEVQSGVESGQGAEEVSDASQNVTGSVSDTSRNVTENVSDTSRNLTEDVSDTSQNLTENVSDIIQNLSDTSQNPTENSSDTSQNVIGDQVVQSLDS